MLARLGVRPDRVLSSPYLRAAQTAEVLLKELDLAGSLPIEEDPRLAPDAAVKAALAAIREAGKELPASATLVVVGHEPLLSSLAASIVSARGLRLLLRKGGLIEIDVDDPKNIRGSLLGLLRPRHTRS